MLDITTGLDTHSVLGTPSNLFSLAHYLGESFTAIKHAYFPAAQEIARRAEQAESALKRLKAMGDTSSPDSDRLKAEIKEHASRSVSIKQLLIALRASMEAHESVITEIAYWAENSSKTIEGIDRPRTADAGNRLHEINWKAEEITLELTEALQCAERISDVRDELLKMHRHMDLNSVGVV